jgi:hypothetical protein
MLCASVVGTQVHVRAQCSVLGTPRQHTLAVTLTGLCRQLSRRLPGRCTSARSRRDIACKFRDLRGVRPRVGRIRPTSRGVAGHLQRGHGPHLPERRPVPVAVDGRRALRDGCCAACVRPVGPTTGGRRRPASSHRAGRGAGSLPECEARSARGGSPPSSRKLGTTRSSVPSQGTGHSVRVPGPLGESSVWPSVAFRVGSTALCL